MTITINGMAWDRAMTLQMVMQDAQKRYKSSNKAGALDQYKITFAEALRRAWREIKSRVGELATKIRYNVQDDMWSL